MVDLIGDCVDTPQKKECVTVTSFDGFTMLSLGIANNLFTVIQRLFIV